MDNLLILFDEDLQNRYKTLLENIKNNSNSFYDAYNSLLENFFRTICPIKKDGSIYNIIKEENNKNFLLNEVLLEQKIYNKVLDYALKMNKHKHNKEKNIEEEIVIKYMTLFYDLVLTYSKYKKYSIPKLDIEYYKKLFHQQEIEKSKIDEIHDYIKNIENEKIKEKEKEENYKKFHCGKYSIESYFTNKKFNIYKYTIISIFLVMFILYFLTLYVKDKDLMIGAAIFLIPSFICYFSRFVNIIKQNKCTKSNILDFNKYTYVFRINKIIPMPSGKIKKITRFMNFFNSFLIIFVAYGLLSFFGLSLFILSIIENILFNEFQKSYSILVLHTIEKDEFYDPFIKKFVLKTNEGDFTF